MARREQLGHDGPADESGCSGDEDAEKVLHTIHKREVLFADDRLAQHMTVRLAEVAPGATALEAVTVVMEDASEATTARAAWARKRAEIVAAHPERRERELAKMGMLAVVLAAGLRE